VLEVVQDEQRPTGGEVVVGSEPYHLGHRGPNGRRLLERCERDEEDALGEVVGKISRRLEGQPRLP
jgi:hypothetical protein